MSMECRADFGSRQLRWDHDLVAQVASLLGPFHRGDESALQDLRLCGRLADTLTVGRRRRNWPARDFGYALPRGTDRTHSSR